MTSKEWLGYYKKKIENSHQTYRPNGFEQIEKDLEVLDMLKEVIKNNVFDVGMLDNRPNGETWLSCEDFGITLKTKNYYKIMEWLNNE